MSLLALVLALTLNLDSEGSRTATVATEAPMVLLASGVFTSETVYRALLVVGADGSWRADGKTGQLSPVELAEVVAGVAKVVLTTTPAPECPRTTPVIQMLQVPRGQVRFAVLCGPRAHPSVTSLIELAESYTTRRPTPQVVRLDRWRPGKADRKESIILLRNGSWSTDNGVGHTGGPELDEVIAAFDAAVIEVETQRPGTDCAIDRQHVLELPGRATLQWAAPCQTPSPTLQAALAKLFAIVNLR